MEMRRLAYVVLYKFLTSIIKQNPKTRPEIGPNNTLSFAGIASNKLGYHGTVKGLETRMFSTFFFWPILLGRK